MSDDEPTPAPNPTVLGVVLAAGAGSRYVGDSHKLEARMAGKPLVWWATWHAMAAGFAEVVVIQGACPITDLVPPGVSIVHNDDWSDGQAGSLRVAVHYAEMSGYDEVVIGVGDQPLVPPEAWRLVAACDASPIAVASFDGHATPPVRLHSDVWTLLPVEGDEGARQLLRSRPELVTEVPCPGSGVDIDTAGGLAQAKRNQLVKELGSWI